MNCMIMKRNHGVSAWLLGLVIAILAGGCAAPIPVASNALVGETGAGQSEALFAMSRRADRAYSESRWIDAVREYQRVVEQVPEDAAAWFRLGNTYAQQGAYDRAIHAYETSIMHDATQPKPWFNLSTTYLLKARDSMRLSRERLREGDPARLLIEERLQGLARLVHGRFEDSVTSTGLH